MWRPNHQHQIFGREDVAGSRRNTRNRVTLCDGEGAFAVTAGTRN
jgi:hypothetical protein